MIVTDMIHTSEILGSIDAYIIGLRELGYHQMIVYTPDAKDKDLDDDQTEIGLITVIYLGDLNGEKTAYFGTPESFAEWQKEQIQ